jgi:ABC-type enterochelin transport system substrate-binding protein
MTRSRIFPKLFYVVCIAALMGSVYAQDAVHAVAGAVTKVDKAAKTIAVKTTDGSEEVFNYSAHTAVRDSRGVAHATQMGVVDTYFAGKEGTRVVVRYLGKGADKGADKTATLVEDFGKDSLKVGRGTVTHVDKATRTVAIKTDNGAEATYKLGPQGVVETDHGVEKASRYAAKEGDKVVVHYTEDARGKVVRFFKKI